VWRRPDAYKFPCHIPGWSGVGASEAAGADSGPSFIEAGPSGLTARSGQWEASPTIRVRPRDLTGERFDSIAFSSPPPAPSFGYKVNTWMRRENRFKTKTFPCAWKGPNVFTDKRVYLPLYALYALYVFFFICKCEPDIVWDIISK
jgi:hypothetical protein